ncbi:hypothetical protein N0V90_000374 [Kalmusia sp. IMI 367209]|nr:hypothetical protein N0V90_000374 [Kalmusia sp. IMI 367209]
MLAPRASSAFVCLRCELNLARPRLPVLPRRAPHAYFSTSDRRHDAFDEHLQAEAPTPRPKLSEHPLGRLRRRKGGRAIRATTAQLEGTKTLGEDAAILVLKEVGERPAEQNTTPEIARDESYEAPKLSQALAEEKPATPEEIVKLIDSLRPKPLDDTLEADEANYVSQSVFIKLSHHLLRAFTGNQLSHYYSVRKGVGKSRVVHEVMEGVKQLQRKSKRPAERSEWSPGTTEINRRLPTLDMHKAKRKAVSKHLLVDQILRDVWKLVMLEEIEGAGELELALQDWQLSLLTSGASETPLDQIGKTRMAKLEIHATDKVLRITADKHTAEYAADDVERLLQGSESHRFHIKPWSRYLLDPTLPATPHDMFSKEDLQTVTTMTGAYLQPTTTTIIIRAFDKDTIAEAERCLIKMMPLKRLGSHTIDTTGSDALQSSECFLPITFEKEAVSFNRRNAKLGRWSLPSKHISTTSSEPVNLDERIRAVQEHVIKMVAKPGEIEVRPPEQKVRFRRKWAIKPESRLRVGFGHVVFTSNGLASEPGLDRPYFLSALPGLSSVLTDDTFKLGYATPPTLVYQFMAVNESLDIRDLLFPTLSISFKPDSKGQHKLRKVTLGFDNASHQVLLPEKAVDLHFETSKGLHMYDLQGNNTIQDFAAQVLANIQSGGRLSAPNLELEIPRWTIAGLKCDHREELRKTKFLFTGIKFSQGVWGKYMDRTVTYTTSQSGKLGRKGGQFSMIYGLTEHSKKDNIHNQEKAMNEFVADAFKMAGKITEAAAVNQSAAKRLELKIMLDKGESEKPGADEGETATADIQSEAVATQMLDKQDVATFQTPKDHATLEPTIEEPSIDRTADNTIEAISQPAIQTQEFTEDPSISSMLESNTSSDIHHEPSTTSSNEESAQAEQKCRVESPA